MRLNQSRHLEYVLFHMHPPARDIMEPEFLKAAAAL
jgi:hypothetical protein